MKKELCNRFISLCRSLCLYCPLALLFLSTTTLANDPVHKILEKFCYECHDSDVQKGKFQLDSLSKDIASGKDAEKWHLVVDQLNLHEMPPLKKKQPESTERQLVIDYITTSLLKAAENNQNNVQVALRRLTKQQYTNPTHLETYLVST